MTTPDRRRAPARKEYLTVPVEVKSVDAAKRRIELYSATWDLDLGGDVIHKGAFARTISHFKAGGKHIPLVDSHRYDSIFHALGSLADAEEDARGVASLWDVIGGADGERVMDRVEGKAVRTASIGYQTVKADRGKLTVDGKEREVRNLREIKWEETSLVLFPMNPAAEITGIKSFAELTQALKDGTLSDDERAHLRALLADPPPDEAKAGPDGLAPDDPTRLALEALCRDLTLSSLATGAPPRRPARGESRRSHLPHPHGD